MDKKKIARTKRRTKLTTEKPVDQEIHRAAKRAGLPSFILPESPPAAQLAFLKDHIVSASDRVSEALASVTDMDDRDCLDLEGVMGTLREVHLALFRIRWECYASGGDVKMAEQAGGAS